MNSIDEYRKISQEARFRGWPLVGEYKLGEKIPFFGQVVNYRLETGEGVEDYYSILRYFGWAVVFGVTKDESVITLVQWKPGVNEASWELPPGGIGETASNITTEALLERTQARYLKETGYGKGTWHYLGATTIETGKFRGASTDDHGLLAHMYLATDLEQLDGARNPSSNEIMTTLMVPLSEFDEVLDSGLFREASALACALLAMRKLS